MASPGSSQNLNHINLIQFNADITPFRRLPPLSWLQAVKNRRPLQHQPVVTGEILHSAPFR